MAMNKVILSGNITEYRVGENGRLYVTISEMKRASDQGILAGWSHYEGTAYPPVSELIHEKYKMGEAVSIEGHLSDEMRRLDDGSRLYKLTYVIDRIEHLAQDLNIAQGVPAEETPHPREQSMDQQVPVKRTEPKEKKENSLAYQILTSDLVKDVDQEPVAKEESAESTAADKSSEAEYPNKNDDQNPQNSETNDPENIAYEYDDNDDRDWDIEEEEDYDDEEEDYEEYDDDETFVAPF